MTTSIKFDRRAVSLRGAMTLPEMPDADALKELIFKTALLSADDRDENSRVLSGLLRAYVAQAEAELYEESDGETELELVNDGPSHDLDYAAEKIWRKYVVAGYLFRLPACKGQDENELYDRCTWYEFPNMTWTPQLLAETAFARGVRDALEAEEMAKWATQYEADRASA